MKQNNSIVKIMVRNHWLSLQPASLHLLKILNIGGGGGSVVFINSNGVAGGMSLGMVCGYDFMVFIFSGFNDELR